MKMTRTELTLGPVLYNWSPERWRDYYFEIADEAPVDNVCVGEVVCSKRAPFFEPVLADVLERLEGAGKRIIHAAPILIMDARDTALARALTSGGCLYVEANDLAEVADLKGRPFAVGPFVNAYNEGTVAYLARQGATRICLPAELPIESIDRIAKSSTIPVEVQVFGRIPLAISARCYHARAHGLHKSGCQYVCGLDEDGMVVRTVDGVPFLTLNGTQTQSYTCLNLTHQLARLQAIGISAFRLNPQAVDMVAVSQLFRDVTDNKITPEEAMAGLTELWTESPFSNGFLMGQEGVKYIHAAE